MSSSRTSLAEAQTANVRSIAHKLTPPDTHRITLALQTTLDVDEMLTLFSRETWSSVPHDGIRLRRPGDGLDVLAGSEGRYQAGYRLSLDGEELGELSFLRGQPFGERDLANLEYLLCSLVYPLRNALKYRAALRASLQDPLTGIGNRAALRTALDHEVEMARRHELPLCLLTVDIDLFKQVNDSFGHSVGDTVLRAVATRIRHALRASDQVFRYGGEEFVAVLSHTERDSALVAAERVRSAVADYPVDCGQRTLFVTVSVGSAVYEMGDDAGCLFDRADQALYRAKRGGRNRVAE